MSFDSNFPIVPDSCSIDTVDRDDGDDVVVVVVVVVVVIVVTVGREEEPSSSWSSSIEGFSNSDKVL